MSRQDAAPTGEVVGFVGAASSRDLWRRIGDVAARCRSYRRGGWVCRSGFQPRPVEAHWGCRGKMPLLQERWLGL